MLIGSNYILKMFLGVVFFQIQLLNIFLIVTRDVLAILLPEIISVYKRTSVNIMRKYYRNKSTVIVSVNVEDYSEFLFKHHIRSNRIFGVLKSKERNTLKCIM